jgi:SAM-dependent methyltransferase
MSSCNERFFWSRTNCPICGSHQTQLLFECAFTQDPLRSLIDDHYKHQGHIDWQCLEGTDYVLCGCGGCGSLYQKHVPNAEMLDKIYNQMVSSDFESSVEVSRLTVENFNAIAGEWEVLFGLVGKHPSKIRVLDYGCGYGRWARVAVAMGAKVFGTEISPEKIANAHNIGVEIVSDRDLDNLRFDIIHTEQVFEHLTEPRQDFRRLASTLSDVGVMKVCVPPLGNIKSLLKTQGMVDRSPSAHLFEPDRSGSPTQSKKVFARSDDYICIIPLEHLNAYSSLAMERLAKENKLKVVSTVRRASVPVNTVSIPEFAHSFFRLCKVNLRPLMRRNANYYLFSHAI